MSLRDVFLEGFEAIHSRIMLPKETQRILASAVATRNSVTEITGSYGVAKSTWVYAVMRVFFHDQFDKKVKPVARFRETLTEFDVFWFVNIMAMQQGIEEKEVTPRPIATAPFKFINEVRRGSPKLYQAMLSLLAEHELEYKGRVWKSDDFICFMDSNPKDTASNELPKALIDRIDVRVYFNALGINDTLELLQSKEKKGPIVDSLPPLLTSDEVKKIWAEVDKVETPPHVFIFLSLFHGALACVYDYSLSTSQEKPLTTMIDRTVTEPYFRLMCDFCEYNGSLCSRLNDVWGLRWIESAIRFSKALAWLDGLSTVNLGHIVFALPYCLNHRLMLKNLSGYPNPLMFIRGYIPDLLRTVGDTWKQAAHAWAKYMAGDMEALSTLKTLAERNSAVKKLVRELEQTSQRNPVVYQ